jgi:hypothetical protein
VVNSGMPSARIVPQHNAKSHIGTMIEIQDPHLETCHEVEAQLQLTHARAHLVKVQRILKDVKEHNVIPDDLGRIFRRRRTNSPTRGAPLARAATDYKRQHSLGASIITSETFESMLGRLKHQQHPGEMPPQGEKAQESLNCSTSHLLGPTNELSNLTRNALENLRADTMTMDWLAQVRNNKMIKHQMEELDINQTDKCNDRHHRVKTTKQDRGSHFHSLAKSMHSHRADHINYEFATKRTPMDPPTRATMDAPEQRIEQPTRVSRHKAEPGHSSNVDEQATQIVPVFCGADDKVLRLFSLEDGDIDNTSKTVMATTEYDHAGDIHDRKPSNNQRTFKKRLDRPTPKRNTFKSRSSKEKTLNSSSQHLTSSRKDINYDRDRRSLANDPSMAKQCSRIDNMKLSLKRYIDEQQAARLHV